MVFISIQSLLNSPCFDAASPLSTPPPPSPPDMVASSNGDLYTPFPHMPVIEEGVQSSEEGSDLHSPVFEASYATPDGTYTLSRCSALGFTCLIGVKSPVSPWPLRLRCLWPAATAAVDF